MTAEKIRRKDSSALLRAKRHRCNIPGCGKAFTRLSHLQRHALNHSEKQWVCSRCNAPFKRLDLFERHKARHLVKDSLAGGSGLGVLQTRRKNIPGAVPTDASGPSVVSRAYPEGAQLSLPVGDPSHEATDSSRNNSGTLIKGNEVSTGQRQEDSNVGIDIPELPLVDVSEVVTATSSSMNLCELGDMYYDTAFDSVHFDVMAFTCSPPESSPDVPQSTDGIDPYTIDKELQQTLHFRPSPRSLNWTDIQSPRPGMTIEDPEVQSASGLQRNMNVISLLNDSTLLHRNPNESRVRCVESPFNDTVQQKADREVGSPLENQTYKSIRQVELPPAKRDEILDLLAEIRPIYPDGSLVDVKTGELSLQSIQEYLDLFFRYFNTSYPMVHVATLEIGSAEPIFLLSMIILGATYKNKDSHQLSVSLYDAIVPYILSGLMSIPIPDLATLQAFLILECYGMYRAGPYQRENAILIHTLLFSAIRRVSRYHVRGGVMLPNRLIHHKGGWKEFAYAEQYTRLILFVFMWDAQNVSCYSFMPNMSTHTIQVRLPCAKEVWEAKTQADWEQALKSHEEPPTFDDMVKQLVENGDKLQSKPLDGLSLTLVLHGLMSMCNDMVHFDNRSVYLGDLEKGEASWTPWRRRMTHALETWKAKYDAYTMAIVQNMEDPHAQSNHQKESIALLALYHTAHIVINSEIRHLQAAAGAKAIFGHIVTSADRQESTRWVEQWIRTQSAAADHAAWHAAQMFHERLLYLKNWDVNDVFHYPWCLVIGTLTCWAFHHFGGQDLHSTPAMCNHPSGVVIAQEQSRALMNHLVSLMASVSPTDIRRTLRKCCTHGLAIEVARYLKSVRWTAAFEAMKLLEGLSGTQ